MGPRVSGGLGISPTEARPGSIYVLGGGGSDQLVYATPTFKSLPALKRVLICLKFSNLNTVLSFYSLTMLY